jgi:hypothetical protein
MYFLDQVAGALEFVYLYRCKCDLSVSCSYIAGIPCNSYLVCLLSTSLIQPPLLRAKNQAQVQHTLARTRMHPQSQSARSCTIMWATPSLEISHFLANQVVFTYAAGKWYPRNQCRVKEQQLVEALIYAI